MESMREIPPGRRSSTKGTMSGMLESEQARASSTQRRWTTMSPSLSNEINEQKIIAIPLSMSLGLQKRPSDHTI